MLTTSTKTFEGLQAGTEYSRQMSKITKVYIRLMFLRIGEIDTLNEKYQAQAAIEARWPVDIDKLSSDLSSDDQHRLADGKSISLTNYGQSHWHPQLYIENALGDLKEQIRYSAKRSKDDNQIYVCEHRDIKGMFWEKLELQYFPSDVQDLSISVASMLYDDKVVIVADPYHVSGVNREAFVDQQEWLLYEHVDTQPRYVKEFLFRDDDDDEEDGDEQLQNKNTNEDRKRSILTVTCHAARRSDYFFWNGYCLILMISLASLCVYGIPPHQAANRIQIACTLLLTSITFRWTINRSLPTISYLTSLDIYSLACIFYLVINCIWHGVIGALVFLYTPDFRVTPDLWLSDLDRVSFYVSFGIFLVANILSISWLYAVPLKERRNIAKIDAEYRASVSARKNRNKSQLSKQKVKQSSNYERIPIE